MTFFLKVLRWILGDRFSFRPLAQEDSSTLLKTKKLLQESEEKFRVVFHQSADAIFLNEFNASTIDYNQTALRRYGYDSSEWKKIAFNDLEVSINPQEIRERMHKLLQHNVLFFETTHRTKTGKLIPTEVHSSVVSFGDKHYVLSLCRDVSERKAIEFELQRTAQSNEELLKEVNHRVKNNLMAIQGLLLTERTRASTQNLTLEEALDHMHQRVQGLLEAHQLLSDSHWSPILIQDLVERIIRLCSRTGDTQCQFEYRIAISEIFVSPRQASNLALVFNELATNAIKHVSKNQKHLLMEFDFELKGSFIEINIRDNGPGYPEKLLNQGIMGSGFQLIRQLVEGSLRGSMTLSNHSGAVLTIRIRHEEGTRT